MIETRCLKNTVIFFQTITNYAEAVIKVFFSCPILLDLFTSNILSIVVDLKIWDLVPKNNKD